MPAKQAVGLGPGDELDVVIEIDLACFGDQEERFTAGNAAAR
jgi:hypothetical protein